MQLSDAQAKLTHRYHRAVQSPRLMMLYPPVSTGEPYDGRPDLETLWASAETEGTLYVHVPFCRRRCPFCPFYATVPRNGECADYVDALLTEAALHAPAVEHMRFTSVYFGGGTPSVLEPRLVERLIRGLGRHLAIDGADVTLEAHPETIDHARVRDLCAAGVTRMSLGVQAFDEAVLEACGRGDTTSTVFGSLDAALEAPLRDVNVDLMYGLPEQTMESWLNDLRIATERGVPGLTLYATVYVPSFEERCTSRHYAIPTAGERDAMYEAAFDYLTSSAYPRTHFGAGAFLRGTLNPHRRNVSLGLPMLGLGTWAYSNTGRFAYHNHTPAVDWAAGVRRGQPAIRQLVQVPDEERARKYVIEALLLAYVDLGEFRRRFGVPFEQVFADELAVLDRLGLARVIEGELRLTRRGGHHLREIRYLFASEAIVETLEADAEKGL